MEFRVGKTPIRDVLAVVPEAFRGDRGFFSEEHRQYKFKELGLREKSVQSGKSCAVSMPGEVRR